jgi:topoisomerase-4 subunit B
MIAEKYTEESIKSLDWKEHIRTRPGMYIGKLGDGASQDDGIYVLVKETLDNAVDEYVMGYGKTIDVTVKDNKVTIRDYGRGIPLGKLIDCVSKINTGAKYDSKVFKKTVGLNGVGTKAVNALSDHFRAQAIREGRSKAVEFSQGLLINNYKEEKTNLRNGTIITFIPDDSIFGQFHYISEYIEKLLWNYVFLNRGLAINFNGEKFYAENGLHDDHS